MRSMKTRFGAGAATLLLMGTLAACGSSGTTSSKPDASKATCPLSALPESGPKVKVSLWYGGLQGEAKQVMTDTVKAFNASQDRVQVTASDQGSAYSQITAKYTQAIQGKRIPNIVYTASNDVQYLADSGTIIPGQACVKQGVVPLDHIEPVVRSYFTLEGTYIPAAVNVALPQLYYNKKQFEQAGMPLEAPGTIAQLRSDAEKLKKANIDGLQWPISMTVNRWFFETFLNGVGQDMVNHDNGHKGRATKATFDTPTAVKLLKTLKGMYDDGLIAKISNTPGQLDQYLNVAQGKSTILLETSTAATTIEAFLGGKLSAKDLEAGNLGGLSQSVTVVPGFGPMPGIDKAGQVPISGGAYYVSNGGTKAQQAGAMAFMRYINEVPQQVTWHVEGSYLPSNDQVPDTKAVKKFWQGKVAGLSLKVASKQLAAMSPKSPGPVIGPFEQYDQIIQKMLESVFLKGADIKSSLAKAQSDVTEAIQNYNSSNGF